MISRCKSPLFSPVQLNKLCIPNRFMRSASGDFMGNTKSQIKLITNLSRCDVGLIVSGSVYCESLSDFSCFEENLVISNWRRCIRNVHENTSKIIFQIAHKTEFDTQNCSDVHKIINKYVEATKVLREIGADGIQLSLADNMPLYKLILPSFNTSQDRCTGNMFGIVRELIHCIKRDTDDFPISIKIDTNDYKGARGIEPKIASSYIGLIKQDVDFFEISSGSCIGDFARSKYNEESLCRSEYSISKRQLLINAWKREFNEKKEFQENYNMDNFRVIKKNHPDVKFALVGGIRKFSTMEKLVMNEGVDLISMSRPFINDPYFIQRLKVRTLDESLCKNCGACLIKGNTDIYCSAK